MVDYDKHADHALLIYKPTGKAIGTMRVIFADEKNWHSSFPLQSLCSSPYLHDESYVKNACELSRMCVSKEFRDYIRKNNGADFQSNFSFYEKPLIKNVLSMAPFGVVRGAMEVAMKRGIYNILGVMETRHMNRLQSAGLVLEQIGPEMQYHGTRVPFIGNFLDSYENTIIKKHDIWSILTLNGQNHKRALEIDATHPRKKPH